MKKGTIINIKNETGSITIDPADIKRVEREYYKQFHMHTQFRIQKQTNCLKNHKPIKLTKDKIDI